MLCRFDILLCDGLTAFLNCHQCLTFSLFTVLSYTTLQAQYPSGWLSNTDAFGSVEQEYRLVSWSTFTTARDMVQSYDSDVLPCWLGTRTADRTEWRRADPAETSPGCSWAPSAENRTQLGRTCWRRSFESWVQYLHISTHTRVKHDVIVQMKMFRICFSQIFRRYKTRKASCRWQTRATLAKRLHGLRKSSGVVSCIASLPIDSLPYGFLLPSHSNFVSKMHRFRTIPACDGRTDRQTDTSLSQRPR